MANCRQACPYNTLYGCKVKEYYAICPLTNMTKPITEYKMTNADRIRAMSDEELAEFLRSGPVPSHICFICGNTVPECNDNACRRAFLYWLQQPTEVDE